VKSDRLDAHIFCDMPNAEERAAILHAYIKKLNVAGDLDLDSMALRLDGSSPADVQVYVYVYLYLYLYVYV
jgi:ATP-dependent 26S proteasome regulatory subunit